MRVYHARFQHLLHVPVHAFVPHGPQFVRQRFHRRCRERQLCGRMGHAPLENSFHCTHMTPTEEKGILDQ
jgi:hypothetical protein